MSFLNLDSGESETMRIFNFIASMIAASFAAQALAQDGGSVSSNEARGLSYSTGADSATLPTGVARVRLPYQRQNGDKSFDKDGKKEDAPVKATGSGGAFVLEYGINDDLSLQMKVDYRLSQSIKLTDKSKAEVKTAGYVQAASALGVSGVTDQASLEATLKTAILGVCQSKGLDAATCEAAYTGGALKTDAITTSSQSALVAKLAGKFGNGSTDIAAKDYVSAAGVAADKEISAGADAYIASNEFEGKGSLGDTIIGVLYNPVKTAPLFVAVGAGVRIPTGNRNLAEGEYDSTRSAYEFGVRWNLDYLPVDWFMVSWQNQWEVPFAGTKREVGGVSTEVSRKGARNVGFVYFKPSLHLIHPSLEAVKINFGVTYDYDNGEYTKVNGVTEGGERSGIMWQYAGVGYSFLHSMKVPLQLDVDYEMPYRGKNVSLATNKLTTTLKGYYRF